MAFGELWHRDRRRQVSDPYNAGGLRAGSWAEVDTIDLPEAYLSPGGSSDLPDAERAQVSTGGTLYVADSAADVRIGDRVWRDPGVYFYVNVRPSAERNPFTGWSPYISIPVELTEG